MDNQKYDAYIEALKEIAQLNQEVLMLRDESGIAREAIDRYCPPELRESADKWLMEKGL